jgi:hypothetical protein
VKIIVLLRQPDAHGVSQHEIDGPVELVVTHKHRQLGVTNLTGDTPERRFPAERVLGIGVVSDDAPAADDGEAQTWVEEVPMGHRIDPRTGRPDLEAPIVATVLRHGKKPKPKAGVK